MVNVAIYGIHGYYGLHKFVQLYGRCDPHIFGEQSTATGLCARGDEAVFAFSPNPDSHAIILQHYGNWPAVTAPGLPVGEDPELICFGGTN